MRIMGLDFGAKTTGIAMSDPGCMLASPVETVFREEEENLKQTVRRIRQLAEENDVHTIVLGLPKNMNNTLGERAEKTLAFKRRLERDLYQVEVLLWDERLSTRMAEKPLLERGLDRHKRKQVVDQIAAVYILQGYLDARKTQGENEESIR
ncbi:MAG TPA: Holliday junction resolvase RuvX [Candidatus Faecimorpha stercoravium]|nr:Holliday junction resolvase RuvX [Candidatus Faecimorpha stercoravium]